MNTAAAASGVHTPRGTLEKVPKGVPMQASEGIQAETLKVVVVVAAVCGVPIGVTMALPRPYTGVQKGCTEMLL
jgi:hypothetical protein